MFEYTVTIRIQSKSQPRARQLAYDYFKESISNNNPESEDYVWLNKSIEDRNV